MSVTYGLSENAQTTNEALYPQKSEIATLFDRFIKEKRFVYNLSERTLHSYSKVFRRWERFAGGMPTQENLLDFMVNMRQSGHSPTTCNITIRSFNSFLTCNTFAKILRGNFGYHISRL